MRPRKIISSLILIGCFFSIKLAASPKFRKNNSEIIDISKPPSTKDWRYFLKLNEPTLKKLWDYQVKRKKKLRDWNWVWRLGWIKACSQHKAKWCVVLQAHALTDQAMVVRSEAAHQLGIRYQGSANPKAIALLKKAFINPANYRNGKPLFAQHRILEAIRKIGGKSSTDTIETLSIKEPWIKRSGELIGIRPNYSDNQSMK